MSLPQEIIKKISKKIAGRHLLLLLDFDGTLAPLRKQPEHSALAQSTRQLLLRFAGNSGASLAIVTGRDMRDIKEKVDISGIIYASNHGCLISGPGISRQIRLPAEYRSALQAVYAEFLKLEKSMPGVRAEKKLFSVVLHFRNANPLAERQISELLPLITKKYAPRGIVIKSGKKIFEAMPNIDADKGSAVKAITEAVIGKTCGKTVFPVYIGDDLTDENAFREVNTSGVSVLVGERAGSAGQFRLSSIADVRKFIRLLLHCK